MVWAAENATNHDITTDSLLITQSGTYNVTGGAQTANNIVVDGDIDVTLVLDGINIQTAKDQAETNDSDEDEYWAPIDIVNGADVTIELNGDNSVKASYRYAGIHIDESSVLTIQDEDGNGSLTAVGGTGNGDNVPLNSFASGAGIGGNGAYVISSSEVGSSNFGTLNIVSGTVTATGGDVPFFTDETGNLGGAAGIGAGGNVDWHGYKYTGTQYGNVNISGGTVNATGGGYSTGKAGGAGIGTGGTHSVQEQNGMVIKISDGTVVATGIQAGAGIGGGAHTCGCQIEITGGNVTATGTNEIENELDALYSPAGIGGGSTGYSASNVSGDGETFTEIIIRDAVVKATGANTGAGIGAGAPDVGSYSITIGGAAVVTATGGSYDETRGGAGIGAGHDAYTEGTITIEDTAKVTATGGCGAAGIGAASPANDKQTSKNNAIVLIQGQAEVTATGGYGAAGIGAGYRDVKFDEGALIPYFGDITITDESIVTAIGGEKAAGIGGGYMGHLSNEITISKTADVMALGGEGGAGIGLGYMNDYLYFDTYDVTFGMGTVSLLDNPTVVAVAGEGAQAIGFGGYTEMLLLANATNLFNIGEGVSDVWLFNRDDHDSALLGIIEKDHEILSAADAYNGTTKHTESGLDYLNKDTDNSPLNPGGEYLSNYEGQYHSDQPVAIWDNTCNENFQAGGDAQWDEELALGTGGYSWTNEGDIITIYQNDTYLRSFDLSTLVSKDSNSAPKDEVARDIVDYALSTDTLSNWATFDIETLYTVSYDLNGGTGDTIPEPTDYYAGTTVTVTGETATREDYTFVGWVSDYDNITYKGDGTETFTMPYQDVILTAQWEKVIDPYTVSYDLNGGTGDTIPAPTDYYPDTVVTVTGEKATREGYTFVGWVSDYDSITYKGDGTETFSMPNQDVILTAQWEKIVTPVIIPTDHPDTGDHSNMGLTLLLALLSLTGLGAILFRKKAVSK